MNNNMMMLENVMKNFPRRVLSFIDEGGQHFQHLLRFQNCLGIFNAFTIKNTSNLTFYR
jgi:hypothetical protein